MVESETASPQPNSALERLCPLRLPDVVRDPWGIQSRMSDAEFKLRPLVGRNGTHSCNASRSATEGGADTEASTGESVIQSRISEVRALARSVSDDYMKLLLLQRSGTWWSDRRIGHSTLPRANGEPSTYQVGQSTDGSLELQAVYVLTIKEASQGMAGGRCRVETGQAGH